MLRRSRIVSAFIGLLMANAAAQAAISVDFETPGYVAGDVYNNSGTTTLKWSGNSGVFDVASGVGKGGTSGIITHTSGTLSGTPSVSLNPTTTTMGQAFATQPQVTFSLALKLVSVAAGLESANTEIFRIYVGASPNKGSAYAIYLSVRSNGNILLNNGNYDTLNTWTNILDGNGYHTISGIINYPAGTYNIGIDGGTAYESTAFAVAYDQADYANYGGIKINRRTTDANNVIALDDIDIAVVPEPAAIGFLSLGSLALLKRKASLKD